MNTKSYWLELLRNGYWILPVAGRGRGSSKREALAEAKRPLVFCKYKNNFFTPKELVKTVPRDVLRRCFSAKDKARCTCVEAGGEWVTWKSEEILAVAEELARKGHNAFALYGRGSGVLPIDIDVGTKDVETLVERLRNFVDSKGLALVRPITLGAEVDELERELRDRVKLASL